jgi:hypothetical protein
MNALAMITSIAESYSTNLGMLVIFSRTAPFDECHVVSVTCKEMLILNVTNRCLQSLLASQDIRLLTSKPKEILTRYRSSIASLLA